MNASEMKSLELEAQKFADHVLSANAELEFTPKPEAKSVKEAWAKIFVAVGINDNVEKNMDERRCTAFTTALHQWVMFVPNNSSWAVLFADFFDIFWAQWHEKKTKWAEWQETKTLARKSEKNP